MSLVKDQNCKVVYHEPAASDYFRIGLETGWSGFIPGQFGMLEVPHLNGVLLRRPFSFARQQNSITEILYKKVGKGTEALSQVPVGSSLKLLGPLGRGFSSVECIPSSLDYVAVAGGYGVAPFLEMASQLKQKNIQLHLYYGARSISDLLYLEEFQDLGVALHLSTQDGSQGQRGLITELLAKNYSESSPKIVWSCGPMGLLAAVKGWSEAKKVPCELSVEEAMGCGTGICLGCVVQNSQGEWIRACKEGPVFRGEGLAL